MSAKKKRYQIVAEQGSLSKDPLLDLMSEEKKKYDPTVHTDDLIADLRRVQSNLPGQHITRRIYRTHGKYSDATWDSRFGTFEEYRKQARLELSRGQQKVEKAIAKHASLDVYRGFAEMEVMPWNGRFEHDLTGRWKTQAVISDLHGKDVDPFVYGVFLGVCRDRQPDIITFDGDVYENYEFSRFDVDPRQWDAAGNLKFVRDQIFAQARLACPGAQIDLLAGNHEHHLLRHVADRTPEMRAILSDFMGVSLADLLGLRDLEINLRCQHDLAAFKPSDIREQIKTNRKTYFGTVTVDHYADDKFGFGTNWVAGHTHKPRLLTHANEVLGAIWGVNLGCGAKVDNNYTGRNHNANSFLFIHYDTHKKQAVHEHIVFSDDSCVVGGKRYTRK